MFNVFALTALYCIMMAEHESTHKPNGADLNVKRNTLERQKGERELKKQQKQPKKQHTHTI